MPNTRTYPQFPIPSVGAVILHKDHLLLIQRGQPPSLGKWTLPGGVIEVGESPEEAVVREVQEECRLTVAVISVIDVVNRVIRDEHDAIQYHYVILDYLVRCQPDQALADLVPHPGSDVVDARWIPLPDIMQYALTEGLLPILRAGIALHKQWQEF